LPGQNNQRAALADEREIIRAMKVLAKPGQVVELRALNATEGGRAFRFTASGFYTDFVQQSAFVRDAASLSGRSKGTYITLNPVKRDLLALAANRYRQCQKDDSTTDDTNIEGRRWLPVDFDYERLAGISTTDEEHEAAFQLAAIVRDWLTARGWPAPIEADSGNGAHLLYRIEEPNDAPTTALLSSVLQALALHFNDQVEHVRVDTTNFNAARIWKLYGTMARKGDNLPERPHRISRMVQVPAQPGLVTRAQLEALAAELPQQPKEQPRQGHSGSANMPFDVPRFIRDNGLQVAREVPWQGGTKWVLGECPMDAAHRDNSAYILQFPSGAVEAGCHHDHCKWWRWGDLREKYEPKRAAPAPAPAQRPPQQSTKKAPAEPSPAVSADPPAEGSKQQDDNRPVVQWLAGRDHEAVDAIVKHIADDQADDPRFFSMEGVTTLHHLAAVPRQERTVRMITAVPPAYVRHAITRVVSLKKWDARQRDFRAASPTETLVDGVVNFLPKHCPPLAGVTQIPVFRADGSLQDTPGYDPATRLVYDPPVDLVIPPVSRAPSVVERAAALALIDEMLWDFPFAGPAERQNAIALFLQPYARLFIAGATPLYLLEAPIPGAGKGLLVDCLLIPAYGQTPTDKDLRNDDETVKWLIAQAISRRPVCFIDNVRDRIDSGVLASAITGTLISGRLLGSNTIVDMYYAPIWAASANNPTLTSEIARRVVRIRLEPATDQPFNRAQSEFRHQLPDWVYEHRTELVHAGLTLVSAWLAAGRPAAPHGRNKGSFGNWARIIGGILHVAGLNDFLSNEAEVWANANTEADTEGAFVEAWAEKFGYSGAYTVKELLEIATETGLIDKHGDGSLSHSLGMLLIKMRDRVFSLPDGDLVRIVKQGERKRAALYGLHLAAGPKPPANGESSDSSESISPVHGELSKGHAANGVTTIGNGVLDPHQTHQTHQSNGTLPTVDPVEVQHNLFARRDAARRDAKICPDCKGQWGACGYERGAACAYSYAK
jgi:hypothetical protein